MNLQFRPILSKAAATPQALQLASMASESSRFFVATVASQRAKQLARGALPRIQIGHSLNTVALAEVRDLTLVTADARLARAAVAHCRVELVA